MSPSTRVELRALADAARSEVKKWGGDGLNLLHVAAALARRWPDEFIAEFGSQGRERVESALRAGVSVGDEASVEELLANADGPHPIEHVVHTLFGLLPQDALSAPAAAAADMGDRAQPAKSGQPTPFQLPTRTRRYLETVAPRPDVRGREGTVDEIIRHIGRRHPLAPLLVGASGSGRTAVLGALAARLSDSAYGGPLAGMPVVRTRAGSIVSSDRANALRRIIEDLQDESVVLAIDDLEVLAALGAGSADVDLLGVVRSALELPSCRVLLTIDQQYASRLDVHDSELMAEIVRVELPDLPRPVLEDIAESAAEALGEHHQVEVPSTVVQECLAPRSKRDAKEHPGLAIRRLDGACTHASLAGWTSVKTNQLGLENAPETAVLRQHELAARLGMRVLGQDAAVSRVSMRLALTKARLDLRPDRPDGVFLFVGPTGVGKTELARGISLEVFGDERNLIRLDMSEYAHEWAISRLTGPQPGFVGFTEPESWLTTRIIAMPQSVLLLDEIEKAHPTVWNVFLQVFDAGRLSDARGNVADFSQTIVAMTSNLGAQAFSAPAVGFGRSSDAEGAEERRVIESVRETMAPELVNRIDEIVVFRPLSEAAIHEIARKEATQAIDGLRDRGLELTLDEEVIDLLSSSGYDPAFGARHLQRNIERLLLQPLVGRTESSLHARVVDSRIEWRA